MIIGFDGSRAFVKDKTGTENYSYQLFKSLAKIDHQNQYIVYIRRSKLSLTAVTHNFLWPRNFKFVTINLPRLWTQVGLAKQTFQDKLDVLFIPAHTSPLIYKPGLKTVVTVHDLGAEFLPSLHQIKQRLYLKWITHYQLKNATKLIAVSKATKDDLVKKVKIDPQKIEVIYEGYDQKQFKPVRGDKLVSSLQRFDIEEGKYFLFVGTVQPRKNLARLIEAFAKFRDQNQESHTLSSKARIKGKSPVKIPLILNTNPISLVIVGSRGWLSDDIYKLPQKLGIQDKVKFLGYVDNQDLPALYSGAIALTYPSLFEGFGLPILEAQSCGCPVITSGTSSMPEVAGDGAILVNPYSLEDIIKGMERIKNHELRIKLTESGFENIKKFSWEKCARETLNVLEEVTRS